LTKETWLLAVVGPGEVLFEVEGVVSTVAVMWAVPS
jgi:hypothetical protein